MKPKVIAFVPIKLNSQRLPKKNLLPLGDHSLCWYIFKSLLKVNDIDDVYVFCSDEEIKKHVPHGVKFLKRNTYLDGDKVKGNEIYQSFIELVDSDIYILAHTTSPFILNETIENALSKVINNYFDSAFSVQKKQTFAWYNGKPINYELNQIPRTQDISPVFIETSGFFIFKKQIFVNYGRRIGFNPFLQEVNEFEAVDIDTRADYEYALKIYQNEFIKSV
ncbi:acylneuraminate cytidylyltransferase family protein [Heyndrickxia oleronia]|nr:acylneuraminate cytidylyltransferase family protein [Heyndrickxia oleronia]MBU5210415.1 acylneuraminate cytidylyltransferase family protein [Heyndrickxia oleronia]MEC1374191.1 acylneuraminate cytidylyltransferase family protein [Heyndrickxia oleronia]NYV64903.1 acylneuraminate cytidylyltransferase family protein [Bacillus sp. Gen3]QQZ07205.1 acylneuraminate cytidylyltransferase family protein [Heyndrickxia oleronia]